jgi:hypothetical protein
MDFFKRRTKIDVVASSGILRVTVPPGQSWFFILIVIATYLAFPVMIHNSWEQMPLWPRVLIMWVIISGALGVVYQLSATQIIEFNALCLRICKDIHGWERKQEYQIANCGELECVPASEGRSAGLQCKIGWRKVMVGKDQSEDEAIEVLAALQTSLPGVAQKLCSYPNTKDHFITLGLGK